MKFVIDEWWFVKQLDIYLVVCIPRGTWWFAQSLDVSRLLTNSNSDPPHQMTTKRYADPRRVFCGANQNKKIGAKVMTIVWVFLPLSCIFQSNCTCTAKICYFYLASDHETSKTHESKACTILSHPQPPGTTKGHLSDGIGAVVSIKCYL